MVRVVDNLKGVDIEKLIEVVWDELSRVTIPAKGSRYLLCPAVVH